MSFCCRLLITCWLTVLGLSGLVAVVQAEEGGEAESEGAASGDAIYLPIRPAFVVNYGGPGRLRYIKALVSVRASNPDAANSIRHHIPYIRHSLMMLFAKQTDSSLDSQEAKMLLREEASDVVRALILEEDGVEGIEGVYFNEFVIQR